MKTVERRFNLKDEQKSSTCRFTKQKASAYTKQRYERAERRTGQNVAYAMSVVAHSCRANPNCKHKNHKLQNEAQKIVQFEAPL